MSLNLPQSVLLTAAQATATTASVIPAVAGTRIYVTAMSINNGATANTFALKSHTTTSIAFGPVNAAVNATVVLPYNPDGWIVTAPGEALDLTTTAASTGANVSFNYVQI